MKTVINIKADKEVKEAAQKLAGEIGLSLSAIVNASLKQFVRKREVHFSVTRRMTPYLEGIIKEARNDYRTGKNIAGPFVSAKEMDEYLDSL
ncbi:hypothetical protein KKA27_00010 [Patescibacteria group bacterium]|nr:hypothetical protein [Patescibacteria group bacterium]MBU2633583.1 hypothetical protein [Patescibacteria group bacterium]